MKKKSLDYIVTADHYAELHDCASAKSLIVKRCSQLMVRTKVATPFKDVAPSGDPAIARIDWGQWIADCPDKYCNGAEFVSPNEPIFYCFSCGNYENNGKPRKVKFPSKANRVKIEKLVLARPVLDRQGINELDRAKRAIPQIRVLKDGKITFFARNWTPPDTLKDLEDQNKAIDIWLKDGGKLGIVKMNSFATHPTVVTGQSWSASDQNTYVKGNFDELQAGFSVKGDIGVAVSATELSKVSAGDDGQILVYDDGESSGVRVGQYPISLSVGSMILPSTGGTACAVQLVNSTDTSAPVAHWFEALFDDTQTERAMWTRALPSLMGSAAILRVHGFMPTATAGNIGFQARFAAKSSGDQNMRAKVFGGANSASQAVPGTSKTKFVLDITITDTNNWAKDDEVIINLSRDIGIDGNAAGNCVVTFAQLLFGT